MDGVKVGSQTTKTVIVISGANRAGEIVRDEPIGSFRVPDGVKITSAACCRLLESNLLPWLDDVPLQKRKTFVFQHDNAPAH